MTKYSFFFIFPSLCLAVDGGAGAPEQSWRQVLAKAPYAFEPNRGQAAAAVRYLARAGSFALLLEDDRLLVSAAGFRAGWRLQDASSGTWQGERTLRGSINYRLGKDPRRWIENVPTHASVRRAGVYPGVDLVVRGDQRQIEYLFELAPGAGAASIRMVPDGGPERNKISIGSLGELVIEGPGGRMVHRAPVAYQNTGGRRRFVPAAFVIVPNGEVRFQLGEYDPALPLTIDPVITVHTFQGGRSNDSATAIAVSADRFIHYAGWTESFDLYLAGSPFRDFNAGRRDVFVTKLYPDGSFFFSTYVGGEGDDVPAGMAVDGSGNVLVTGTTTSNNFPVSSTGFQTAYAGGGDAFLFRMSAQGSGFQFVTYIGGSGTDVARDVDVDAVGNATAVGYTNSVDFPTRSSRQSIYGGGPDDMFLFRIGANGVDIGYSTYYGGAESDQAHSVAIDPSGQALVTGRSVCSTLGGSITALGPGGGTDAVVMRWSFDGAGPVYLTCFGGNGSDIGWAIASDATGAAYVAGSTTSTNLPAAGGAQTAYGGGPANSLGDGFAVKVSPAGNVLVYSTYLGGTQEDFAHSIAASPDGTAWIAGITFSGTFPGGTAFPGEGRRAFAARLSAQGRALLHSNFFDNLLAEDRFAVTVDSSGDVYLAGGVTANTRIPAVRGTPTRAFIGMMEDAFVAKLASTRIQMQQDTYPPTVPPGSRFGLVQRVVNRGPEDAERIVVTGTVGTGASVAGCTATLGVPCFSTPTGYRLEIPALPAGRAVELTVSLLVDNIATGFNIPVAAVARSETFDPLQSDNEVTAQLFTAATGTFCNYAITPVPLVPAAGGQFSVQVTAPQFCPWSVALPNDWMTLISPAASIGSGPVTVTATARSTSVPRIGSITVAGQRLPILQRGSNLTPSFTDVPVVHPFFDTVELMRTSGITAGCGGNRFCPDDTTTRGQMAVFLVRAMLGSDTFTVPAEPFFADVQPSHPQFRHVQKLRELGITSGCTAVRYCPDDPVTRSQMAVFVVRARLGLVAGQAFPFPDTAAFQDVPQGSATYDFVQKMRELGVTAGCGPSLYCPNDSTTRAQMSAFLSRAFLTP